MPDLHDLELVIRSKVPLIIVESHEENRVSALVTRLGISRGLPIYGWSITQGLRRIDIDLDMNLGSLDLDEPDKEAPTCDPEVALRQIVNSAEAGIFLFCDLHPFLTNQPKVIRLLKDVALKHEKVPHTIIMMSHALEAPPEIRRYTAHFELSLPNDDQLYAIIREESRNWTKQHRGQRIQTDTATLKIIVNNLQGLTYADARKLIRKAIYDDGAITHKDVSAINTEKFRLMALDGVLSMQYDTAKFSDVGGLNNLKHWLEQRRTIMLNNEEHASLDKPKGILLLGVQGGGKSLAAKTVAGVWGLPLLRLDFASLYNKYVGETERSLRDALQLAEQMSPCILWMDEIEKGISSGSDDGGISKRLLGTLLTWMAEREKPVFMVATANDISKLPPELIRKGRFDEIFFVDLPDEHTRKEIFTIHLNKRHINLDNIDCNYLAAISEGYSGSEIEQVVVSALYNVASKKEDLNTDHLTLALESTRPLSVTMKENIDELRRWAADRTVPAN
ncbi:MAG: AAA family ATPase [Pseudomonadales bacterium]|nr:AAA family ATPase [Pseudomonadales bacterium]